MKCERCGTEMEEGSSITEYKGEVRYWHMLKCPKCGLEYRDE